jgi:hypothetical protein
MMKKFGRNCGHGAAIAEHISQQRKALPSSRGRTGSKLRSVIPRVRVIPPKQSCPERFPGMI